MLFYSKQNPTHTELQNSDMFVKDETIVQNETMSF